MSYKQQETADLISRFNEASEIIDGVECWSARKLAPILGYSRYRNFLPSIKKAKTACSNSGVEVSDHMADVCHMVKLGSKAERGMIVSK